MAADPGHRYWREDVAQLVENVEYYFSTRCNTYDWHPPNYYEFWPYVPLDHVSVDFWSPWGRGYAIDGDVGYAIIDYKEGASYN